MLFDKIASEYLDFSIENGEPRDPALCQLYRYSFVPYCGVFVCYVYEHISETTEPVNHTSHCRHSLTFVAVLVLVLCVFRLLYASLLPFSQNKKILILVASN